MCDKGKDDEAFDPRRGARIKKGSVEESNAADASIAEITSKPVLRGNASEKMQTIHSMMRVLVKYADEWFYERNKHNLDERTQTIVQGAGENDSDIETDGEKRSRRENDDTPAI